jgi:hypothetical protein
VVLVEPTRGEFDLVQRQAAQRIQLLRAVQPQGTERPIGSDVDGLEVGDVHGGLSRNNCRANRTHRT